MILLLCIVGSYITNNNPYDVIVMAVFGLVGYLMKKFKYEVAPLILAIVLGPIMEKSFQRSLMMSDGGLDIFVSRPFSVSFLIMAVLILLSPLFMRNKRIREDFRAGD